MTSLRFDQLNVSLHANRTAMGAAAAHLAAESLRHVLKTKRYARMIVASAPSQNELLAHLAEAPDLEWHRVTLFHMDEYVGLPASHPASFRAYQYRHLLHRIRPAVFHGIQGEAPDSDAECARYASLLSAAPVDVLCLGIGENGHIAFNDPPVAKFADPALIKVVELDPVCRQQQVNDGCFPDLASVPTHAYTLTCPALLAAQIALCVVPGPRKAVAVRNTLHLPISSACPSTALRQHPRATLFLDPDSAALLG